MFRKAELILLSVSVAIAFASTSWFGFAGSGRIEKETIGRAPPLAPDETNAIADAPWELKDASWSAPSQQSRGSFWIYELFTPPEIFYDADSREFKVTASSMTGTNGNSGMRVVQAEAPFYLQLMEVKHALFRLQLIGFIKTSDKHFGLFENTVNAEILLACEGAVLPQLGLLVEKFEVQAQEVSSQEMMTTHQTRATAVVRDQLTGQTTRLTSSERYFDPRPRATLVTTGQVEKNREVSEGDLLEVDNETFEVDEIRMSPPEVVIICRANDRSIMDRRTLRLRGSDPPIAKTPSS